MKKKIRQLTGISIAMIAASNFLLMNDSHAFCGTEIDPSAQVKPFWGLDDLAEKNNVNYECDQDHDGCSSPNGCGGDNKCLNPDFCAQNTCPTKGCCDPQ